MSVTGDEWECAGQEVPILQLQALSCGAGPAARYFNYQQFLFFPLFRKIFLNWLKKISLTIINLKPLYSYLSSSDKYSYVEGLSDSCLTYTTSDDSDKGFLCSSSGDEITIGTLWNCIQLYLYLIRSNQNTWYIVVGFYLSNSMFLYLKSNLLTLVMSVYSQFT